MTTYKKALAEARTQLATLALLQNQVVTELTRVTAIVDTLIAAEGITVELPKTAADIVLVPLTTTTDRYHYHDPMNKQSSVVHSDSMSDAIGNHLKLGVKWDSQDYIADSRQETPADKLEDLVRRDILPPISNGRRKSWFDKIPSTKLGNADIGNHSAGDNSDANVTFGLQSRRASFRGAETQRQSGTSRRMSILPNHQVESVPEAPPQNNHESAPENNDSSMTANETLSDVPPTASDNSLPIFEQDDEPPPLLSPKISIVAPPQNTTIIIQEESGTSLEEDDTIDAPRKQTSAANNQMLGGRRPTISRSYLRVRNETLEKSARTNNKISPAVSAAFPDLNVPSVRSSVAVDPRISTASSRGKELWAKVPGTVVKKSDVISGLAVTALPDINTLKKTPPPDLSPKFKIVPYDTWEAKLHWFFLCPAFDEKGGYISIQKYHTMDYRKHTFWEDGLNPMGILPVVFNFLFISVYFTALLLLPYQAAYFETIEECTNLTWTLTAIFFLDTVFSLFTPLKPPKQDTKFRIKRPTLKQWQRTYLKKHIILEIEIKI
ncbi:UNVERIFIED_CONTAM: hypothetical protein HDU68_012010 [Siphonaria sp. JEL0065]|nr:hypothetical protein HDU68_012010 [Siphonaria sp. JEL0065]